MSESWNWQQGVRLPAISEFDLRVFLYELLPITAMTTKAKANEVRMSLKRFFEYLAEKEELSYPWAAAILRDKFAFDIRWDAVKDEQFDEELSADLDARVLLPSRELAGVGEWGDAMGVDEARLIAELQRLWLIWRDEEIALGHTAPDDLRDQLSRRQAVWERAPNTKLKGKAPSVVIARERKLSS